jgi:hypothetical protein
MKKKKRKRRERKERKEDKRDQKKETIFEARTLSEYSTNFHALLPSAMR